MARVDAGNMPSWRWGPGADTGQGLPVVSCSVCVRGTASTRVTVERRHAACTGAIAIEREGLVEKGDVTTVGDGRSETHETQKRADEGLAEGQKLVEGLLGRLEAAIRRRPGTALLVALGAGFIVGRIVRR